MGQFEDYGPDVDVVRTWVLDERGRPLTLRDLYPSVSRQEAYRLWGLLCQQLTAAASLAYALPPNASHPPQLGCWGPRPDLREAGVDDDSATALLIGVAVDRSAARRPPDPRLLVLAVRSAMVAALKLWLAAAQEQRRPGKGSNGHA